jgi:hypothetical protein
MFIGHYAPAAFGAGKGNIKLWHAFIAVQFVDIIWSVLILMDIEHLRIVPHFTKANHFDLYHMPYTHSLLMSIVWGILAGCGYKLLVKSATKSSALLIAALVLSHWFLDILVHVPDMTLWFGSTKYGFGVWNIFPFAFFLEIGLFALGMFYYLKNTKAKGRAGQIWPIVFIGLLVAVQYIGNFGPPPASPDEMAISALFAYGAIALGAFFVDKTRTD